VQELGESEPGACPVHAPADALGRSDAWMK
jgi:hypothetical protein